MRVPRLGRRSDPGLSIDQWANYFSFNGNTYPFSPFGGLFGASSAGLYGNYGEKQELPDPSFEGYVWAGYKSNGVVFACMLARLLLFSEARFQFRRIRNGRPGDLFGTGDLRGLERPWVNGTTGDLLTRMEQDSSLAGNFYATRAPGGGVRRMRPDWVSIVLGSQTENAKGDPAADPGWELDAEVVGYLYHPGGPRSGHDPVVLLPENVAHYAPIPDPVARYRGMSWLTPVLREMMADSAATSHKLKFFENGATPNLAVKLDPSIQIEAFKRWTELFRENNEGVANAYKTLFLGGGADVTVVGKDMKEMSFKETQGAGETRIAAAAGVPPVIVGLSEGLAAATYSNYAQARRRFADLTMRPLWRNASASLATLVNVPSDAELWYDDRDIPALQEDRKDAAEIQRVHAETIHSLITSGYEPASVIEAVLNSDYGRLKHTGMFSVQLNPAGTVGEGKGSIVGGTAVPAKPAPAAANGSTGN